MKCINARVLAAAAATVALSAMTMAPATAGEIASDDVSLRVVGGEKLTDAKANPGAVLTTVNGKQHCSAVRIAPTWVVTARHCIEDPTSTRTFVIDTVWTDSLKVMQGPSAKVKRTVVAPTADMILLELASAPAGPIAGWADTYLAPRATASYYGWGYTSGFGGRLSDTLKRGEGSVSGVGSAAYFGGQNYAMRGLRSCIAGGDSGGPLVANGKVQAVASWSMAGGDDRLCVMGFTPLAQNAAWITSTTGMKANQNSYYHKG